MESQIKKEAQGLELLSEAARRAAGIYEEKEMEILIHSEHGKRHFERHEAKLVRWNLSGSIMIH